MSDPDIDQVHTSYKEDNREAFYQMIKRWKQTKGKDATYQALETALHNADLRAAAQAVAKYRVDHL